jgi:hypothetical protein
MPNRSLDWYRCFGTQSLFYFFVLFTSIHTDRYCEDGLPRNSDRFPACYASLGTPDEKLVPSAKVGVGTNDRVFLTTQLKPQLRVLIAVVGAAPAAVSGE